MSDQASVNTDKELWREPQANGTVDYYSNSIFVTERGGIGINVGGSVHVRTLEDWHKLAEPSDTPDSTKELREQVKRFCRTEEAADNLVFFIEARTKAAIKSTEIRMYVDMLDYYVTDEEVRKQLRKKLDELRGLHGSPS